MNLYLNQAKARMQTDIHTDTHAHMHVQNTIYSKKRNQETVEKNMTSK